MTRFQADAVLLFAAALWGVAFLFQKDAMQHVGPLTFIAARAGLAAIVLTPLAFLEQNRTPPASPTSTRLVNVSLASATAFLLAAYLQQEGLRTASVTNTGFLTSLYVVLTPLVAWIASASTPARTVWPAIALSFLGTWLLGGGTAGGLGFGDVLVMAGSLFWAIHCVITARASLLQRPLTYTALQFAAVAGAAGTGALLLENPTIEAIGAASTPILFVGLISTALTYTIFSIAIRHTTPPEAAVLLSAESLFAAGAGAAFLGERLSGLSWAGAGLMISAVLLVQLGPWLSRSASRGAASG